jgi:hypothetical protein
MTGAPLLWQARHRPSSITKPERDYGAGNINAELRAGTTRRRLDISYPPMLNLRKTRSRSKPQDFRSSPDS